MTELDIALAEQACGRLQHRYGVTADRGDVEGFVGLFTADGSIKVPEHPAFVGHDAIRASIQALAATGVTMRHLITNGIVDVADADHATGLCYLTVYNSVEAPDAIGARPVAVPGTVGEFHDVFRRTPEGWRFQSRVLSRVFRRTDDAVQVAARTAQA